MTSEWNGKPIAKPWRQGVCGSVAAIAILTVMSLQALVGQPNAEKDAQPESAAADVRMPKLPSPIAAFAVASVERGTGLLPTGFPHSIAGGKPVDRSPVPDPSTVPVPFTFRMIDGDAFPVIISIPSGPAWRDVFRTYGGAIGVSNSSSPRPAYLNHTISPDGRVDEESVPTIGRFLFRLSEEAIRVVNASVDPAAQIPPGHSAFGVFAAQFRSVVASVLQDFCTAEHVNPDDLAGVQLELGPGFGLRVASMTRRARKF
jgi:hypothetical protein